MKMKKIKILMLAFALVTASVATPLGIAMTAEAKNTPTKYKTTKKNYIVSPKHQVYVVAVTKKGGKTIKSVKELI